MVKLEDFERSGYDRFDEPNLLSGADFLLQKRITDDIGIRYFVNVHVRFGLKGALHLRSFQPDVQFSDWHNTEPTFNVTYFVRETDTVNDIEMFFEKMWRVTGAYYEKD